MRWLFSVFTVARETYNLLWLMARTFDGDLSQAGFFTAVKKHKQGQLTALCERLWVLSEGTGKC